MMPLQSSRDEDSDRQREKERERQWMIDSILFGRNIVELFFSNGSRELEKKIPTENIDCNFQNKTVLDSFFTWMQEKRREFTAK